MPGMAPGTEDTLPGFWGCKASGQVDSSQVNGRDDDNAHAWLGAGGLPPAPAPALTALSTRLEFLFVYLLLSVSVTKTSSLRQGPGPSCRVCRAEYTAGTQ